MRSGQFVGYRGVGRDITERKRAEDEHREHVRFLESMDRVNRAIQGTGDLEQMMNGVLDAVLRSSNAIARCSAGTGEIRNDIVYAARQARASGICPGPELGVELAADEGLSAMSAAFLVEPSWKESLTDIGDLADDAPGRSSGCFPGAVRLPARRALDNLLATLVSGDSREVAAPAGLPLVSLRGRHRVALSGIRVSPRGGVTIARTLQCFSRLQLIDEIYLAADAPAEEPS